LSIPTSSDRSARPLVSIIMPCRLGTPAQAALLNETLRTVSSQTCQDYEVTLVDDGSPVPVAPVADAHPRTTTIIQANAGPAVARNTGIAHSRGQYLVFLDADDDLLPSALAAGIKALETHPDAGFAVGPREEMTFEGEPVPWDVPPPPPQSDIYLPLLRFDWYIIPPSSAMFRREAVESVGGFRDPWGADDLDFYLRVAHRYRAFCYQAPAVTRYRRYSTSSSRDGERMLHSIRAVYARQWPLVEGVPAAEEAFHHGLRTLTEIFLDCIVENIEDRLRSGDRTGALRSAGLLSLESPERWQALHGRCPEAAMLTGDPAEGRECKAEASQDDLLQRHS
jgi:glycosyltransferase involved in cell wall biosynthesis